MDYGAKNKKVIRSDFLSRSDHQRFQEKIIPSSVGEVVDLDIVPSPVIYDEGEEAQQNQANVDTPL